MVFWFLLSLASSLLCPSATRKSLSSSKKPIGWPPDRLFLLVTSFPLIQFHNEMVEHVVEAGGLRLTRGGLAGLDRASCLPGDES